LIADVDRVKENIVVIRLILEIARVIFRITLYRWLLELTHHDNIHGWRTSLR